MDSVATSPVEAFTDWRGIAPGVARRGLSSGELRGSSEQTGLIAACQGVSSPLSGAIASAAEPEGRASLPPTEGGAEAGGSPSAQARALRDQVAASLPGASEAEIQLGSLFLWERSLDASARLASPGGPLTAYLSSVRACVGAGGGPLAVAAGQVLHALAPESGFVRRQDSTYLSGLPNHRVFAVSSALGGVKDLHGVQCAGLWNESEAATLGATLAKLEAAYPSFREKLSAVVVQTWIGDKDPSLGRADIGGNVDTQSPGMFRLNRSSLRQGQIEHFLFHEFGHLIDIVNDDPDHFQFASHEVSAFRGRDRAIQCVTPYARTAIHEDFAETFAFCVQHREKMLAHSDLYFHSLGPLSDKFRHVFTQQFSQEIPPPSPRHEAFLSALREGRTPFGVENSKGKIEGAAQHSRWAIKELAVGSALTDIAQRLKNERSPEVRKQLEFIQDFFLEGKDVTARPSTVAEMEGKLLEFADLQARIEDVELRLAENRAACEGYNDPSEVPAERVGYTSLRLGQRAIALGETLENLDQRPPESWLGYLRSTVKDPVLLQGLTPDLDAAQIRQAVQARQDQLFEYYEQLSQRQKAESLPQERERLQEEFAAVSARYEALKSELTSLIITAQNDFRRNLSDDRAQEAYYSILRSSQ